MNLVSQIVGQIDQAVLTTAGLYFQNVSSAVLSLYTALLGLLFAFLGVAIAFNVFALGLGDAFRIGLRIVLVFAFGLSWANFSLLYDALTNASQNLAMSFFAIGGSTLGSAPAGAMDQFAGHMGQVVDSTSSAMGSIMRGVVGAILYIVLAVLMAAYVLIVGFSKIMLAFLLGLAPLAMMFTIFERTKTLFEAWLSAFVGYLLYPVAAAGIIGTIITVSNAYVAGPIGPANPGANTSLGTFLGFLVIIFTGFFALWSIPQAVANLTGQFNLAGIAPQALSLIGKPASFAAGAAGFRARNFGAGFLHGATERQAQYGIAQRAAGVGIALRRQGGETMRKLGNYLARKAP